jgi:outer membrane receptor protein involved in Fe transport
VEETAPADDPAGFSSVLRLREPPPGAALAPFVERAPGLRVNESGPGGSQTLSVRGADSQQVAVFLDGFRLSAPFGGAVDLSLLDPSHLEEVEVRRGGSSTRFGSSAIGGVLLLRTPRLTTAARTRMGLGYGSFGTLATTVARADTARSFRYLATASYRQSDGDFGYLDDNGVARIRSNNDARQGELLFKVDRAWNDAWRLAVLEDLSLSARGAPGMSQRESETARQEDLRSMTGFQLTRFDAGLAGGRLEATLSHRYQQFHFDEPAPPVVVSHSQSFAIESGLTFGAPLGTVGRFDTGFTARASLFRDPSTDNPSRLEADLWVSGVTRLFARHLVLVPAVRLASASGFGVTVAPRFGMALSPLRWTRRPWLVPLEISGNVGRSFRYPSFQEMYVRLDGFSGNAELKPEDAIDADLGIRWRKRQVSFETAYFWRHMNNTILFAPVSSFLVRADNYRGVRAEGVEVSMQVRPPAGFALSVGYTHTRTRFGEPAMSLPGHPPHRLKARLEWELPGARRKPGSARRWGVRVWSTVAAESAMVLSRFDSMKEEGRVLLGAGGAVSYRGLCLSAEGQNLLDKRDAVDTVGFPLPPAHFLVSLSTTL